MLHQMVVHFPIAMFSLYVFFELFSPKKFRESNAYINIVSLLLVVGILGSVASNMTGEMVSRYIATDSLSEYILPMHENYANMATGIFFLITVAYLLIITERYKSNSKYLKKISNNQLVAKVRNFISRRLVLLTLAIIGFIYLLGASALGAIMVYGADIDPVGKLMYTIFLDHLKFL